MLQHSSKNHFQGRKYTLQKHFCKSHRKRSKKIINTRSRIVCKKSRHLYCLLSCWSHISLHGSSPKHNCQVNEWHRPQYERTTPRKFYNLSVRVKRDWKTKTAAVGSAKRSKYASETEHRFGLLVKNAVCLVYQLWVYLPWNCAQEEAFVSNSRSV